MGNGDGGTHERDGNERGRVGDMKGDLEIGINDIDVKWNGEFWITFRQMLFVLLKRV